MKIRVNKDFLREYKDDAWKGFSGKEVASLLLAAGTAIALVFLCCISGVELRRRLRCISLCRQQRRSYCLGFTDTRAICPRSGCCRRSFIHMERRNCPMRQKS